MLVLVLADDTGSCEQIVYRMSMGRPIAYCTWSHLKHWLRSLSMSATQCAIVAHRTRDQGNPRKVDSALSAKTRYHRFLRTREHTRGD